jgi:hypothetical protein
LIIQANSFFHTLTTSELQQQNLLVFSGGFEINVRNDLVFVEDKKPNWNKLFDPVLLWLSFDWRLEMETQCPSIFYLIFASCIVFIHAFLTSCFSVRRRTISSHSFSSKVPLRFWHAKYLFGSMVLVAFHAEIY